MLQATTTGATLPAVPLPPVRVLVEDPDVAGRELVTPSPAIEVAACTGPEGDDVCPLVLGEPCPLGAFDVVVSALEGPWAACVRGAWAETGTPLVVSRRPAGTAPPERLAHHVGAALRCLSAARGVGELSD